MQGSTVDEKREALLKYITENQADYYRLVYLYVRNRDNALDIIQDSIIKAWSKVHTLDNIQYMKTWLYRIMINESINFLRKNKRIVLSDIEFEDVSYSVESEVVDKLTLYQAVEKLPPKLKTVIALRFFEDMKISEVALTIKANENTVKSRLYRGIKELKRIIG